MNRVSFPKAAVVSFLWPSANHFLIKIFHGKIYTWPRSYYLLPGGGSRTICMVYQHTLFLPAGSVPYRRCRSCTIPRNGRYGYGCTVVDYILADHDLSEVWWNIISQWCVAGTGVGLCMSKIPHTKWPPYRIYTIYTVPYTRLPFLYITRKRDSHTYTIPP